MTHTVSLLCDVVKGSPLLIRCPLTALHSLAPVAQPSIPYHPTWHYLRLHALGCGGQGGRSAGKSISAIPPVGVELTWVCTRLGTDPRFMSSASFHGASKIKHFFFSFTAQEHYIKSLTLNTITVQCSKPISYLFITNKWKIGCSFTFTECLIQKIKVTWRTHSRS